MVHLILVTGRLLLSADVIINKIVSIGNVLNCQVFDILKLINV